ncbi:MAG: DHH family phosphoesterase, partial [Kiritimatiellae bacterium]|nr:DHH family phosphoesterase [Kiritimatiellia bacterium]
MTAKTKTRKAKPVEIIEAIAKAKSILVTGHVRPDGDSLGGMIALAHLLKNAGVRAIATADSKTLGGPSFLKGIEHLVHPDLLAGRRFDLVVTLDCGSFERLP